MDNSLHHNRKDKQSTESLSTLLLLCKTSPIFQIRFCFFPKGTFRSDKRSLVSEEQDTAYVWNFEEIKDKKSIKEKSFKEESWVDRV